jgi:hypothetical protein
MAYLLGTVIAAVALLWCSGPTQPKKLVKKNPNH